MSDRSQIESAPIFTIGYGAREMPAFITALQAHNIAFLLDIRSKPYSRYKPDFSKHALEDHLREAGIRYVFMGDSLGGQPEDPNCYDEQGKVSYEKVRQTELFGHGMERVRAAWQQGLRVVLMCSEGKPENCHRSMLIGDVLVNAGIEVAHIDEKDQIADQETVMVRADGGQLSLFQDQPSRSTSRKRYRNED